jgi:arylsulfatase A-like enzyme
LSADDHRAHTHTHSVLFFGDDIGYGDLGSFGNPTSVTPALDKMAADGAKLAQYYSAASICSPSRGALMTSVRKFAMSVDC